MGLTALPNVASGSAGAIPTTGTGSNQISVTSGLVTLAGVTHTGAVIPTTSTVTDNATASQTGAQAALVANNLDHLVKIAVDTDFPTTVHLNSVVGHLADAGTSATYDRITDSQEALRDRGDEAYISNQFPGGLAQAAGSSATVMTLDEDDAATDGAYAGWGLWLIAGTGAPLYRTISTNDESDGSVTITSTFPTTPDDTTEYRLVPDDGAFRSLIDVAVSTRSDFDQDNDVVTPDATTSTALEDLLAVFLDATTPIDGVPGADAPRAEKLDFLYEWAANEREQVADELTVMDDNGDPLFTKSFFNDGTTAISGKATDVP
jgi:hypothetical protein